MQQEDGWFLRTACLAVEHAAIFYLYFVVLHIVSLSLCRRANTRQHKGDCENNCFHCLYGKSSSHFVVLYLFSQPDDASVFLLLAPSLRLTGPLGASLLCSYGLAGVEVPTDAKP